MVIQTISDILQRFAAMHEEVEDGERVYLVLEYVPGETLQERIGKGNLPVEQVLAIASSIADAMCAAHQKGIVHRDLKPGSTAVKNEGRSSRRILAA